MGQTVRLLVGTRKGGFIYTADEGRETWSLSEPILPGWSFYHMAADPRCDPPLLYAAANHWAWGRAVARSADLGKTWDYRSEGLHFPADMAISIDNVWGVRPGHADEPGVVYCGTQPAGLFRSEDWGRSWRPVEGFNRHPQRQYWSGTGGGASCVHSVEVDPRDARRVYACVSAGGSYVTRDGGETWCMFSHTAVAETPAARQFIAEVTERFAAQLPPRLPDIDPAAIDEMHKLRLDPKHPDRLWTQAHVGVFRSDDGGATWTDVTHGLPSFHGFPIAVTKRPPDAAFVVPLAFEADNFRVCPGRFTVYRTRDGGRTWQALTAGLPGPHDYQSVYREGMDTDGLEPEGVYVGTSNGQVYASRDGGDTWQRLPGTLPPVLSVTCAVC
jgi:hypothetical protein